MPYVHISFLDTRIATYELEKDEYRIGRAPNNDIVIDNPGVSSSHAVIHKEGDDFVITDAGSKNGLFLKGEKIENHQLEYGDVITIFKHQLHYVPLVGDDAPKAVTETQTSIGMSQNQTMVMDKQQQEELLKLRNKAEMKLVVFGSSSQTTRNIHLSEQIYAIGKGSECQILTSGLFAPKLSAKLVRQMSGYLLVPESRGKAQVNGTSIEGPYRLKNGDEIEIRDLRMLFQVDSGK